MRSVCHVITLHLDKADQEGQLDVSCVDISGDEVLALTGLDASTACIGHVWAILRKTLGTELRQPRDGKTLGTELRQARDGCFYTLHEYTTWYSQDNSLEDQSLLRQWWKSGILDGRLRRTPISLILPSDTDGRVAHICQIGGARADSVLLSQLTCETNLLPGDSVAYIGSAREDSGRMLTEGAEGSVVPTRRQDCGGFSVRFGSARFGFQYVCCARDELKALEATTPCIEVHDTEGTSEEHSDVPSLLVETACELCRWRLHACGGCMTRLASDRSQRERMMARERAMWG